MQGLADTISAATKFLPPEYIQIVIYHHPCPDGALGAYAAQHKFGDSHIVYVPYLRENLKDGLPAYDDRILRGKNVLFIDCAPSLSELHTLQRTAGQVMVLDHHISAANELAGQEGCFFVMQNSGAVIAWHYFMGIDQTLPRLYELVQDRDLMVWQDKDLSLPLDKAIATFNPNFDPTFFGKYISTVNLMQLISKGRAVIEEEETEIQRLIASAESRSYTCPSTNKTYKIKCVELKDYAFTLQVSEILRSQDDVDFCMTWYLEGNDTYRISMRTAKDKNEVDLSIISKSFGGVSQISGGGHANKAGCRIIGSPEVHLQNRIRTTSSEEMIDKRTVRIK